MIGLKPRAMKVAKDFDDLIKEQQIEFERMWGKKPSSSEMTAIFSKKAREKGLKLF